MTKNIVIFIGKLDIICYNRFNKEHLTITFGKGADSIMCKVEELLKDNKLTEKLSMAKLNDLLKKEEEEKKPSKAVIIFAIIGVLVAVAAAAYGIYRFFTPDYLDDFDDEYDDEFDDDFFEDEDDDDAEEEKEAPKTKEEK